MKKIKIGSIAFVILLGVLCLAYAIISIYIGADWFATIKKTLITYLIICLLFVGCLYSYFIENALKESNKGLNQQSNSENTKKEKIIDMTEIFSYKPLNSKILFDVSINVGKKRYDVVYGKRDNTYYCAITNYNVACDVSDPDDVNHNAAILLEKGIEDSDARSLAAAIQEIACLTLLSSNDKGDKNENDCNL